MRKRISYASSLPEVFCKKEILQNFSKFTEKQSWLFVQKVLFYYILCLSVPEKFKNSIFEIPVIPQTLNISNQRTTSTKSINLDIIRKLITYCLKKQCLFCESNVYSYCFEDIAVQSQNGINTLPVGYRKQNN